MSATTDKPMRIDTGEELDRIVAEHARVLAEFYTKGCTLCQSIEARTRNCGASHGCDGRHAQPGDRTSRWSPSTTSGAFRR